MSNPYTKFKVGLALGGGGARGFCHVGVLKALEENGIIPDYIAGTSMGALIGGAYVAGTTPENMYLLSNVAKQSFVMDFRINIGKRRGLFEGERVEKLLQRQMGTDTQFSDCGIPFAVTAVDIESGELKVFDSGLLWQVVRASMSIPVVFRPMEIDGRMYVDGGLLCRVPVDIVRNMGADFVIAVDAIGPVKREERPKNILQMIKRSYEIMDWEITRNRVNDADVFIAPEMEKSILDFKKNKETIELGYKTTMDNMDDLKKKLSEFTKSAD